MSENDGSSKVAIFLAGIGLGAIVALLFAPTSGREARRLISRKADEGRDYVSAKSRAVRRQAEELAEKAKDLVV
jgi:gas vesicle protein